MTKTREIKTPSAYGGTPCDKPLFEDVSCQYNCPSIDCEYHPWTDLSGDTCTPKSNVCTPGHANYQKGEITQLRTIKQVSLYDGQPCDEPLIQNSTCNMPSDYCAQDVCKYEETWSVVPNSCTPNPHVCDQTNHLGYLKGIQTETKSLIEQCKYCGPCPPSITRDTDCEIPSEYCECDGEWSPYTPSCDSFPCGETHIQTRTFELAPGFVPDRSLLCPSPEERQCPVSPCPVVDNPVYTYNGVEYTVFPYEQTLNACSEVGLFEVQDSETCLNISRQHYAADNYQTPNKRYFGATGTATQQT